MTRADPAYAPLIEEFALDPETLADARRLLTDPQRAAATTAATRQGAWDVLRANRALRHAPQPGTAA